VIKSVARIGYHQIRNIANIVLRKPLTYPSLSSYTLDKDDLHIARDWLLDRSNWYDPQVVRQYEKNFAGWNGSKYAFAFMGGRIALSACIHALGLKPGDEAILPGYTCVAVPNAFHFSGVKTVYSDIELDTYGLDASLIEDKITPNTKAILLHHLYGLVCRDYEHLIEIAHNHGLYVIEDCAQSIGAEYKNRKVGNYGDLAIYSTEQSKIMTTVQGGFALTNNDVLADRLRTYYDSAQYPDKTIIDAQLLTIMINYHSYKAPNRWWKHEFLDFWYRQKTIITTTKEEEQGIKPPCYGRKMPAPIAAIGLNQLRKVDAYNSIRRQTARVWDRWCENNGYQKPHIVPESIPVYLRYPVMVAPERKQDTTWGQKELGVSLGVWFVSNIHPTDWRVEGCPSADKAVNQCINFPCFLNAKDN